MKITREDESVVIGVKVKNSGNVDGDEIVQVYISDVKASVPVPLKSLKSFKRIYLKNGEEKWFPFH